MLCLLTVRTLKPGTFDQFRDAFMQAVDADDPPPGMVRFNMIRNVEAPDEVICFGVFDGSIEDLRALNQDGSRDAQLSAIAPFVASTGADGIFDVVEDLHAATA
jgi:heme-degrading monooxygenase HmoA